MTKAAAHAALRRDFARAAPLAPDWPSLLSAWETTLEGLGVSRHQVSFEQGVRQTVLCSNYHFDPEQVMEVGRTAFRFPTPLGTDLVITLVAPAVLRGSAARVAFAGPAAAFAARLLQLRALDPGIVADGPQAADISGRVDTQVSLKAC